MLSHDVPPLTDLIGGSIPTQTSFTRSFAGKLNANNNPYPMVRIKLLKR